MGLKGSKTTRLVAEKPNWDSDFHHDESAEEVAEEGGGDGEAGTR